MLYLLLAWAPVPLASNRPIFWAINGAVACLILILFAAGEIGHRGRVDIDWRPAAIAGYAFALVALWMIAQAIPDMPELLRHPVWTDINGNLLGSTITSSPSSTWTTIAETVPVGFLAVVAMRLAVDRQRATFLLTWIVCVITAIAVYGLVAQALGFRQVLLVDSDAYAGYLTSTFIGRNAVATYFVIGIACATALATCRLEEVLGSRRTSRGGWLRLIAALPGLVVFCIFADLVLAVALLNTGSRGGIIAGGVALLTIALVSLRRAAAGRRMLAAAFAALFAGVLTVAAISSDLLLARLQNGVTAGDRLAVYRDTLDMIMARPLLGHGAGAFIDAFPLYHLRAPVGVLWNRTHDTYLQVAAELGLPAFAVLLFGILVVVVAVFRGAADRKSSHPAAVAALAVLAAVAFHSIVDFSVQIQAVGLTTAVVIGAGLGESVRRRREIAPRPDIPASDITAAINRRETFNVTIPKATPAPGSATTA